MMLLNAVAAGRRRYPVITDGLKLYLDAYNLDSYSGSGSTWTDLSNSGYNFTITGPTWTTSGGRRYFEFDGVNDRMEGATDSSDFNIGTTGYTWSIWIYYVSAPASQAVTFPDVIIGMGLYAAQSYAYPFFTDNRSNDSGNSSSTGQGYMMGVYLNSTAYHTTKAETVPTGSWFQLTFTMTYSTSTTGTFRIYKDGAEITNEAHTLSSGTWATANITRKPTVGCINVDGTFGRFNNIRVGEILRYNRPLTATEVNKNYNATKSNYGKSVNTNGLKLHLDAYNTESYSGSGSTWNDLSNSGYNMTIGGATWTESGGRRYFEFDGVNDYMIGSASTSIFDMNTSGFTWSFWIYYVTSPTILDVVVFSEFVNTGGALLRYYAIDNRNTDAGSGTANGYMIALFKAAPNIIDTRTTYAETVPTGSWFQLTGTFTYNSSTTGTLKIYKNGSQVVTEDHTITGTTWSAMNSFLKPVLGALSLNGAYSRFNNIRLGEVLQYNRPLTATEVDNNYQSTKTNYGI